MICFFPEIYPDELLYSLYCRCFVYSGFPHYRTGADELLRAGATRMDFEFSAHLNDEARNILNDMYSVETLMLNNTMFKQYGRYVDKERKKYALEALVEDSANIHQILPFQLSKNERYIKYCPLCARHDREVYGETFWHRTHQLRNMEVCPMHKCRLKSTGIPLSGKLPHLFLVAETIVPEQESIELANNEVEVLFAQYMANIFQTSLDMDNDVSIGVFLNYQLEKRGYVSKLDYHRKLVDLLNDFQSLYHDWPVVSISKSHQLIKILTEYRIDFYETCQIAFLLGLSSEEIANPFIPLDSPYKEFNDKVNQLRRTGIKNRHLSDYIGSCNTAINGIQKACGNRGYDYSFKANKYSEKWKQMDEENAPLVEKLAKEIYIDKDGKPGKVGKTGITRAMGWPENRTNYLPKCRAIIKKYEESYPEFWARKTVWAYLLLREAKNPSEIYWTNLWELVVIKKDNLKKSFPYLSLYADEETVGEIKTLVMGE